MYIWSYYIHLCKGELECDTVSLKACILTYKNMSHILINKGAMAEYSQLEILLATLQRDGSGNFLIKLEEDPRPPSRWEYNTLWKQYLDSFLTTNTLAIMHSGWVCTVPGDSPYSVPAGVSLTPIALGVHILAVSNEDSPALEQSTEKIKWTCKLSIWRSPSRPGLSRWARWISPNTEATQQPGCIPSKLTIHLWTDQQAFHHWMNPWDPLSTDHDQFQIMIYCMD